MDDRGAPNLLRTRESDAGRAVALLVAEFSDVDLRVFPPEQAFLLDLSAQRLASTVAGTIGFGTKIEMRTGPATDFFVSVVLTGNLEVSANGESAVEMGPGSGVLTSPEGPSTVSTWSADCRQVFLQIPRAVLEGELEQLLGHTLGHPLRFATALDLRAAGVARWLSISRLIADEIESPTGLLANSVASAHLERLALDALLLGQPHSHSNDATQDRPSGPRETVRLAIGLMQERPQHPWSTLSLAQTLYVSPRALQEGFQRDLGMAPMAYLRQVRLRRVHEELRSTTQERTTVQAVAWTYGLFHLGRLARDYRDAYGELPSQTLQRPPD